MSDLGALSGIALVAVTSLVVFVGCFIAMPTILFVLRKLGFYVIVEERQALVYVLFGRVRLILDEPGLHFPMQTLTWRALFVNFFGDVRAVDLRLDQEYYRATPVNSEEGAPMGIGIWYEMWISDPVSYLFKNADPRGSLRTNVGNATVRNLSNLKLNNMLEDRHSMSALVRNDVGEKSREWGYAMGSVYVRKVQFRDEKMIGQIEEKVVNRLRQVTSAIRQDGTNQVNLITSTAERQAAVAFAKAAAMRPFIVGGALNTIAQDQEVAQVMFEILENQKMLEGSVNVTLVPPDKRSDTLTQFLSAGDSGPAVIPAVQAAVPPPVPR